jgi:Mg-chelatase subunit ChlD
MKNYRLRLVVEISSEINSYTLENALKFEITENLPANVDAERYVRQRLAEELARNFGALRAPIDNKTEEAAKADDPLA